jgi:hypothetical protein
MPKTKVKELPITINLQVAGFDRVIKTDNILKSLRELDIDPIKVKSRAVFEFMYEDKVLRKIMVIFQFRRLLANDLTRQILAKYANQSLGLSVNSYE